MFEYHGNFKNIAYPVYSVIHGIDNQYKVNDLPNFPCFHRLSFYQYSHYVLRRG